MKIIIALSFLFSFDVFAKYYTFKHLDCKIRFNASKDFLNSEVRKELKDKGFVTKEFVNGNKMNEGDLYFTVEIFRDPKKVWKNCIVTGAVMKAKNQTPSSKDKALYKRTEKRALPRHTFNGDERCKRALKDIFIHIPYCQTMTVNEKVQGN